MRVILALWLLFLPTYAQGLRVLAASDLRYAMAEIIAAYQVVHPGVRVQVIYGSSGRFFQQLRQGFSADLFFSADAEYVRVLDREGRLVPNTARVYAKGRLAIFVPERLRGVSPKTALSNPRVRTLALANPAHAPYGRAAVAYLLHQGFLRWKASPVPFEQMMGGFLRYLEPVRPLRVVVGESVSHAAQLTVSGADAGLIALSLALPLASQGRGRFWAPPEATYPELLQMMGILKGHDRPEVRAFYAYVLGSKGQAILARYGFSPVAP